MCVQPSSVVLQKETRKYIHYAHAHGDISTALLHEAKSVAMTHFYVFYPA